MMVHDLQLAQHRLRRGVSMPMRGMPVPFSSCKWRTVCSCCIRSSLNHLTCVSVAVIESFAWERSSLCFSERVALQTTESPLSTERDPWHPQSDRKALHPPRCILLTNDKAVNHSVGVKRTHSPTSGASSSSIVKAPSTASVSSSLFFTCWYDCAPSLQPSRCSATAFTCCVRSEAEAPRCDAEAPKVRAAASHLARKDSISALTSQLCNGNTLARC
mmetsp:Transcript_17560/g.37135  ORF Transcript_17560/g.37135 Transcript_17560/m.37135 type:complete len:217 (-) Transcript_17560:279-929(-)